MAKPKKHSQKLINQAHEMAFEGKLTNAQIAKKLKLTKNQLAYIIYQCETKVYAKKAKPVAPKAFMSKRPNQRKSQRLSPKKKKPCWLKLLTGCLELKKFNKIKELCGIDNVAYVSKASFVWLRMSHTVLYYI